MITNNCSVAYQSSTFADGFSGARPRAQQTRHHQQRQQFYREHYQQQRRQRAATNNQDDSSSLLKVLPLIILLILSVYTKYLSSDSHLDSDPSSPLKDFSLHRKSSYTTPRHTTSRQVPYFVNQGRFLETYFPGHNFEFIFSRARQLNVKPDHVTTQGRKVGPLFKQMEKNVEAVYLREKQSQCRDEKRRKDRAFNKAMGFWGPDQRLWQEAQRMPTPSCDIVQKFEKPPPT